MGGFCFNEASCHELAHHAGAVFLSPEPDWASDPSPAARSTRPVAVSCGRGPLACIGDSPRKVARNSMTRTFNKRRKRCNSNDTHSRFEIVAGELRAKSVSVSCGGRRSGGAGPDVEPTRPATHQQLGAVGVVGAGGSAGPGRRAGGWRQAQATHRHPDRLEAAARPAGPGCGARGRWRGLAGLRDDAPSEARGADGERAGRPRGGRRSVGATISNSRRGRRAGGRNTNGTTTTSTRTSADTETTKRAGTPRFRPALNAQQRSARDAPQ